MEIIRTIKSHPNYRISTFGVVYNFRGKVIKHRIGSNDYPYFSAYDGRGISKNLTIHRTLAILFIPNPDNLPEVNHEDGNKLNFALSNLKWGTKSYNQQHAWDNGLKENQRKAVSRPRPNLFKPVHQLDMAGKFIRQHSSIKEAVKAVNGSAASISMAANGKRPHADGFKWRRADMIAFSFGCIN